MLDRNRSRLKMLAAAGGLVLLASQVSSWKRRSRKLTGKVVLLTGGSRGLGLELARQLAAEQCRLILTARNREELNIASEELTAAGADVHTIAADLTLNEDISRLLQDAKAVHGKIDIIINNAGRIDVGPVDAFTEQDFQLAMKLMFWAPFHIVMASLPALLESGDADIVNISSIGGKIAVPHLLPYSVAKFALRGFSEGLDAELRHRGVHVLTVTPGLLRTGSHKQVEVKGDYLKEYGWFALGATTPGISMEVTRAARQIVSALKARRHSLTLTWTAQVAARFHGAFPESSLVALGWINTLLPEPIQNKISIPGRNLHNDEPFAIRALTSLGDAAIRSQNQDVKNE